MKEGEELLAEDRSSKGYLDLRVWQEIVLVISVRSSRPWPRVKSKGKEAALQKRHSGPRPSERNWLVQEQRVDLEHFLNSFKKWTIWEYFTTKYLDLVLLLVYFPEVKCRVVIRKIKENGDWGEKGQFKENIGLFGSWSSAVLRRCCFQVCGELQPKDSDSFCSQALLSITGMWLSLESWASTASQGPSLDPHWLWVAASSPWQVGIHVVPGALGVGPPDPGLLNPTRAGLLPGNGYASIETNNAATHWVIYRVFMLLLRLLYNHALSAPSL